MTAWTYTLRVLRRRPARTLLTLGGIVVGVAILVANAVAIDAARRAYREMYETVAGKDCLEITAPGQAGFDETFAAQLTSSPLVRAVVPRIVATAAIVDSSGATPALVCAVDPRMETVSRDYILVDGQALSEKPGILLDAGFVAAHGLRPRGPIKLWTATGPAELPLMGTIRPTGATAFAGAVAVRMTLPTAQRLFALPDQINSLQLLLNEGTTAEQAKAILEPSLPAGIAIQPPAQRGELARATLLAAEQGLHALGLLAMVAGGFIVLNTSLMNLGERRKELAIFRVLGATRRQLGRMLLGESALLGAVGSGLGLNLGLGFAQFLSSGMQEFLGVAMPTPRVSGRVVVLALLVGTGAAVLPVLLAVRRFGRTPPLRDLVAVRRSEDPTRSAQPWKTAATLILSGTLALSAAGWGRWSAGSASTIFVSGLALLLAGSVLLFPRFISPMLAVLAVPMQWAFGVEGRLAYLQLARRPARTGLTAGVLFLAIAVAIGFGHSILRTLDDVRQWYRQAIVADFLVRGAMPDASFLLAAALPENMGESLRAIPEVQAVDRISFIPARINDRPVLVLARTFRPDGPLPIDLRDGDVSAARRKLQQGEVVLGTVLAAGLGRRVGDEVSLATLNGPVGLRVAGTATEYAGGGEVLYLEWETARKLLHISGVHVFLVTAKAERTAALAELLRSYCGRRGLLLQSNRELRQLIDDSLVQIIGALWALLGVLFVVASLGIANTLTMNVLEQTREFGILRAVGMTRRRVRKLVLGQAVLLALTGLLPGVAAGLALAALLEHAPTSLPNNSGGFQVKPLLVLATFGMASLIVLLAGLLPAERAARMRLVHSLRA